MKPASVLKMIRSIIPREQSDAIDDQLQRNPEYQFNSLFKDGSVELLKQDHSTPLYVERDGAVSVH